MTNIAPAHSPSTRKTGMPVTRSPTKSVRNPAITRSVDTGQLVTPGVARRHRTLRPSNQSDQPDQIADQHQRAADQQGRIVNPHWKPQIRQAPLIDQLRSRDDLP